MRILRRVHGAERWGRAALDLQTRLLGSRHPAAAADAAILDREAHCALSPCLAVNLNNLAASLHAEGKLDEERAGEILSGKLGHWRPKTVAVRENLRELLVRFGGET